jgi:hypothetical protein
VIIEPRYVNGPGKIAAAAALAYVEHQRPGVPSSDEQWAFFCKTSMALEMLARR